MRVGGGGEVPKYHLRLDFADGSRLTVRITSMGIISALKDGDLEKSYLYRRDFMGGVSPDGEEFTFEHFQGSWAARTGRSSSCSCRKMRCSRG